MRRLTQEEVLLKFAYAHGSRYDYSQTHYVNMRTKVVIRCKEHGEFLQLPYDHIKGSGCPLCHPQTFPMTTRTFIQKALKIHKGRYDYSKVQYSNSQTKVCIICPEHGEFWQTPNNHLNGQGCPICNESKGELFIKEVLEELSIKYIQQFKISVPQEIRKTSEAFIDFYLPDYSTFIEFNGKQHYVPIKHFGGEIKFKGQVNRDNYVREYCSKNNLSLIEIKFDSSVDEIKSIISNFINNYERI